MWQAVPKKILLLAIVGLTALVVFAAPPLFTAVGIDPGVGLFMRVIAAIVFIIDVVVVLAFNLYWKALWKKFPYLGRVVFPDVSGVWQGEFSWAKDGLLGSKSASIRISQNWKSIKVSVETDEANSETLSSWIERDADTGAFTLNYVYLHTPKQVVREGNPPHRGTASIVFDIDDMKQARGVYYTDRTTAGDITLRR